jgi:mannose-6-phosphate isomerase-like protein (cupin superfamily)
MLDFDNRPWGRWEEYIYEPSYRVKRLVIFPGKRLSLQFHKLRDENWVIVSGIGKMTLGDKVFTVKTGDFIQIGKEQVHRVENESDVPLVIIETQIGICPEDDIIRIEDDYGRI